MTDKPSIDDAMDELAILLADAELAERRGSDDWLPEWFLRQLAEIDAAEQVVKKHAALLLHQAEAKRTALWDEWGGAFKHIVTCDIELQRGKKKSITYVTGTAGFRKTGGRDTIVIDDDAAAMMSAEFDCPEAVKVVRTLLTSELLKHTLETGEELPGTHLEKTPVVENFYPKRPQDVLEAETRPALEADDG